MKKIATLLTLSLLLFYQLNSPVRAQSDTVNITTSSELLMVLTSGTPNKIWNIENDIVLENESNQSFSIPSGTVIEGNNHVIRTSVIHQKVNALFATKGDFTLKNITIHAPNKIHDTDSQSIYYSPTLFTFGGTDSIINFSSVTINLAEETSNQMVPIYINTRGNAVITFDSVKLHESRLYFQTNSSGSFIFKDSLIEQTKVLYKDNIKDEIFVYQSDSTKTNWTTSAVGTTFAFQLDYVNPVNGYKSISELEAIENALPAGASINYLFDHPLTLSLKKNSLSYEKGSILSDKDLLEALQVEALFPYSDNKDIEVIVTGSYDSNTAGQYALNVQAIWKNDSTNQSTKKILPFTLIITEPQKPIVEPEPEPKPETKPTVGEGLSQIIDADKISIEVPQGAFTEPVAITFDLINLSESKTVEIKESLTQLLSTLKVDNILVFEISPLSLANGGKIQINDDFTVTISLPLPTPLANASNIIVYHVEADGSLRELPTTVKDGVITFVADQFSQFVFAEVSTITTIQPVDNGVIPNLGSDHSILTFGGSSILLGIALILFTYKKKSN